MAKLKQYRKGLLASIHETAEGLNAAGVMDSKTIREFDEIFRTPTQSVLPGLIPTLSKSKIPQSLSYSIGAERISQALASAAQINDLKLHFYFNTDLSLRRGHYEFLRVEYLNGVSPAEDWPVKALYSRPAQYRWEIVVQPVHRVFRNKANRYSADFALPQISRWLAKHVDTNQKGSAMLTFFYDEKTDEFIARELMSLEPSQER